MRLDLRVANSLASVLPTCRVALVFGGALVLAESVVLATSLFAAACLSFVASLLVGARIYRVRAPRPLDAEGERPAQAEARVAVVAAPIPQ
jgi:hypothetical protein